MPRIIGARPGKVHIHITVGQEFLDRMDAEVEKGRFASRSHAIELGLRHVWGHLDRGEDPYG